MSSSSSKMMKKMTTTTTKKQATTLSIPPDMDRIAATEFMMISAAERELAYDELHGVFTKNDNLPEDGEENMGTTTTRQAFEETQDLIESSLVLLKMELERIPIRRKRVYLKAIFLKPSLETDVAFQLMFLRADRFNVPLAAQRMCSFFEEKQNLFGEHKLVHRLTLDDLSQEDIDSMCNGSGHVMPQKDRSGRLVFFADPFFLESKDYRSIVSIPKIPWTPRTTMYGFGCWNGRIFFTDTNFLTSFYSLYTKPKESDGMVYDHGSIGGR